MTRTLLMQARATTRRRQEPTDWYTIGLGVLIVAGFPVQMLVGVATRSYQPGAFVGAPVGFVVAAVVIMWAAVVTAAMAVGPLRASRAEYSCVLSAPLDRRDELRRRWLVNGLVGGVLGAAVGATAVLLTGDGAAAAAGGAVLGVAVGAATMNAATVLQAASDSVRARVQAGAAAVGMGALVTMAVVRTAPAASQPNATAWQVAAAVGLALAVLVMWRSWVAVDVLDRIALTAGNALATATSAAIIFLDPGLLGGVLSERRLARSRVSRSRTFPAGRLKALLAADGWRSARNRRALVVFAAAIVVPYAAAVVVPGLWVPVVALLAGVTAVSPFAVGLRQISSSPVLRRLLGGTDTALRVLHLVVPATLTALFTAATAPAAPDHLLAGALLVPLGIVGNVWIRASGRPALFGATIADFGYGPVPVDLVRFIIRGLGPLLVVGFIQINV